MTRLSGVGVCPRAAATILRSRPRGAVDNALATRARALCWYGRRDNRTARVSFQFQHTVITAAAAARCEAAAAQVPGAGRARSGARLRGGDVH